MLYNTSQSIALSVAVLITALSIQLTECWAQVGSIFPKPLEFFSTDEELILLNTFVSIILLVVSVYNKP